MARTRYERGSAGGVRLLHHGVESAQRSDAWATGGRAGCRTTCRRCDRDSRPASRLATRGWLRAIRRAPDGGSIPQSPPRRGSHGASAHATGPGSRGGFAEVWSSRVLLVATITCAAVIPLSTFAFAAAVALVQWNRQHHLGRGRGPTRVPLHRGQPLPDPRRCPGRCHRRGRRGHGRDPLELAGDSGAAVAAAGPFLSGLWQLLSCWASACGAGG